MKIKVIKSVDGERWYLDHLLHREGGPAVTRLDGTKEWYFKGKVHRVGGPAVEKVDGTKWWYFDGYCHRADGPAVEYSNGEKEWRVNSCAYRAGIRTSRRVGRDVRPRRCTYQLISTATTCVGCSNTGAAATHCGACDAPARSCFRRECLTSSAVGSGSRSAWCASSAGSVRTGRRLGALLLPVMFESKTKVASK